MPPTPYPFDRWLKMSRPQAAALRRYAHALPWPSAALSATAQQLWGVPVTVAPLGLEAHDAAQASRVLDDPLVAIAIEPQGPSRGRIIVELDPGLSGCLLDRSLGGEGGTEVASESTAMRSPLGDVERGVLAYAAARLLAAAPGFRLRGVITSRGALVALLGDGPAVAWSAEVMVGSDRARARAWLAGWDLEEPVGRATLALPRLRGVELTLVADGARGVLSASEVTALEPGDVVVPDECWVSVGDGVSGQARMRLEGAQRTEWRCTIEATSFRIDDVLRGRDRAKGQGRKMDTEDDDKTLSMAGDAPVQISVELARFSLPLGEVASLRPGEVLSSGRPIGDSVTLRAGDQAIATGTLVDVDGEVGVQILAVGGDDA